MTKPEPVQTRQLTIADPRGPVAGPAARVVPAIIADAGDRAARRFLEFFAATIRNRNTRAAYLHAANRFFAWCDRHRIGQLADIEPLHVATYIEALGADFEKPTVKQHLAAIRMLFDWLVTGGVLAANPAHAVRGPKHVVKRGKTPVLTADQARALIESIDTSTLVGLRDRALIGVMTYTFARIGAVVGMRGEDYFANGKRWWIRLHEKGGKRHEMPAHHKLEAFLDAYIKTAGIAGENKSPLFRAAVGRTGALAATAMSRVDAWRMIQRRVAAMGLQVRIGCHTFRATGITAYLEAKGTLENAQAMAAHESPRTTKLYDRRGDEITLDEVERITI
ncbi:Tyrosine-type recombinase/integrase (plasmid) [Rhodovastum atsumiense]|uniref:Tyrosine-type recombinase/integrase n=1 Tax=Rhodovastum atsumiense TaxID=504468 RepID=A0A5M6IMT7_9PROT|nr:tyrosine-type recombinase/integrase [Rhodovastum atsumiense]CAH2606416.1 Tyrosine-type recombinase/integrase [Rhodovastum atsumiense]